MHLRDSVLDSPKKVAVEKAVEIAWQAALDADFAGAALPGFFRAADHFRC